MFSFLYRGYKMQRSLLTVIGAVCALSFILPAHGADFTPGTWTHTQRQVPQSDVTSLIKGLDGIIWAGTDTRLHSWNGNNWQLFEYPREQLDNHGLFHCDGLGRLYFIDNHQLVVLDGDTIIRYDDVVVGHPAVAAEMRDGTVYIGSYHLANGGLFKFDGSVVSKIRDGRVRSVAVDTEERVWATIREKDPDGIILVAYENDEWSDRSAEVEFLYPARTYGMTVQVFDDGSVWVANEGRYGVLDNDEWTFRDGIGKPMFLRKDSTGKIWGYGDQHLYMLSETGMWEESRSFLKGPINAPWFMVESADGTNITVDGKTFYHYVRNLWKPIWFSAELGSDIVTCMSYTNSKALLCGHGVRDVLGDYLDEGISERVDDTWNNYTSYNGDVVQLVNVFDLVYTPDDNVMAYTPSGFNVYDNDRWDIVDSLFVIKEVVNSFVFEDKRTMWIATRIGLVEYEFDPLYEVIVPFEDDFTNPVATPIWNIQYNDQEFLLYMQMKGGSIISYDLTDWEVAVPDAILVSDYVVTEDRVFWGAHEKGLCYYVPHLLLWEVVVGNGPCYFVEMDSQGRMWASTFDNTGYLENGVWHRIPELSGYASDTIAFADDGRIALNLFNEDRTQHFGIMEFTPSTGVSDSQDSTPLPFPAPQAFPNPFNAETSIAFTLPEPSPVTVTVFALSGQKVATLVNDRLPAGSHSVRWDARGDNGLQVSTGVYLCRVEAGGFSRTGKLLLLK
jgi:hypothetical protein